MAVTVYSSTDASAPTLSGSAGALLTVLDACLVNGYGAKTAAGWTKPYVNSGNVGCYKNSAVDGTGYCLSINDAGPGAGGACEARVTGFATLSSVSAGTGQFPNQQQINIGSGALVVRKSTTADATARAWTIIADDTVFYMFVETGDYTSPTMVMAWMFGDIFSFKNNDAYRCMLIARTAENTNSVQYEPFPAMNLITTQGMTYPIPGHFMASSWTGIGYSLPVGKHWDAMKSYGQSALPPCNVNIAGNGTQMILYYGYNSYFSMGMGYNSPSAWPYPNGPDGGLYVSPCWVHHNGSIRGYLKGLWVPLHDRPLNHLDTVTGQGNLSGKSFLNLGVFTSYQNGNDSEYYLPGNCLIETSNTWS